MSAPGAAPAPLLPPHWPWLAAALLFATGFALYAPTLGHEFVDWDDLVLVVGNPWIREISLENLVAITTRPILDSFFPLQSLSYMIDYALWELDPLGYHLHSVLLNAANGALAFWVLLRITRRPGLAFLAAALFTVHHAHVSSASWVSARKELLFTTFLLLSLGAYLRARRDGGLDARAYAASLALFFVGAAAKTTIAVYPLFFLLVDRLEDRRLDPARRRPFAFHFATKLPYFLLALPVVWMNLEVQLVADSARAGGPLDYLLIKGNAAWRYLWILLGLLPGQPIYDAPTVIHGPLRAVGTLLPFVAVPLAFWLALRRGWQQPALGLAWLAIGLIPPLAFPLTTYMADRYLYAPSLGFCWMVAAGLLALTRRLAPRPLARVALVALLALPPALWWSLNAYAYSRIWRASAPLWRYAVERSADGRAATAYAAALIRAGRLDRAEEVLVQAKQLGANGYLHLAVVHVERGDLEEALQATTRGLAIAAVQAPSRADGGKLLFLHGVILARLERLPDAIEAWEAALVVDPDNPEARRVLEEYGLAPDPMPAAEAGPGGAGPP